MINYHYKIDFNITNPTRYSDWINRVIDDEGFLLGELEYIFCDDEYLLSVNQQYLGHNTYTDIITFDYSNSSRISGDIFISMDRVNENAVTYGEGLELELKRVMIHGVLHLMGFVDKSDEDKELMRKKEDEKIKMFHVEQ